MHVLRTDCLLLGFATIGLLATPLRADETFLCEDGRMVTITPANREAMKDNPCVKQWFTKEEETRQAKAAADTEKPRPGYAGGVIRGAAAGAAAAARRTSTATRTVRVHIHTGGDRDAAQPKTASAPRFRLRRR